MLLIGFTRRRRGYGPLSTRPSDCKVPNVRYFVSLSFAQILRGHDPPNSGRPMNGGGQWEQGSMNMARRLVVKVR
jgi:hypothetical protein